MKIQEAIKESNLFRRSGWSAIHPWIHNDGGILIMNSSNPFLYTPGITDILAEDWIVQENKDES